MNTGKQEQRATLKAKQLRLVYAGAVGSVLASTTVTSATAQSESATRHEPRPSIEERVRKLRQQTPVEPGTSTGPADPRELLSWWNGWHNWHNWRNW